VYASVVSGEHGGSDGVSVGPALEGEFVTGDGTGRVGLVGWIESFGTELPPAWRRRIGASVVASIGALLAGVPFYHLSRHAFSIDALAGDALPFVFGLVLLGAGAWLGWRCDDDLASLVTAFWVTVGLLVTGLVTLYFLTLHTAHGHVVESLWFLVYDVAATGAVAGLLISRYDVRSRRRHRRLSQQERRFRAVFEGTLDALVVIDDEGRYLGANPAAADLFGLSRSEIVGRHVTDFVPDDTDVEGPWSQFVDGQSLRGEYELVQPDGETRTIAVAATPNVRPGRHLAALRDVTDRVEREAELDRERARVEFLNRLLRHNVLNGMNLVLAKLDALEPSVSSDRRDDLDTARHRGEEIVDLVQTARRLAADVSTAVGERAIDVREPLTAAAEAVRTAAPEATVECDVPDDAVWVHADGMLETVFDHLLTNAVQHNDAASVRVAATVTVGPETVTITVADDGDGMPPERLAQLFEGDAFAHTRDWGGFGLSIVHALVREYEGRVWAEPNEPSGVAFHVELPRVETPNGRRHD
jgi:PAS domain S-box-containing protein